MRSWTRFQPESTYTRRAIIREVKKVGRAIGVPKRRVIDARGFLEGRGRGRLYALAETVADIALIEGGPSARAWLDLSTSYPSLMKKQILDLAVCILQSREEEKDK